MYDGAWVEVVVADPRHVSAALEVINLGTIRAMPGKLVTWVHVPYRRGKNMFVIYTPTISVQPDCKADSSSPWYHVTFPR